MAGISFVEGILEVDSPGGIMDSGISVLSVPHFIPGVKPFTVELSAVSVSKLDAEAGSDNSTGSKL